MSPAFEDFVDPEGLDPAERERLRRVHELLLEAGPPEELPASLGALPAAKGAKVLAFPQTRRRIAAGLVLAAALTAAAFGGGYLVGDHSSAGLKTVRVVAMQGGGASGALRVGAPDRSGNWPIAFKVDGLPEQKGKFAYYELFLVHDGKPSFPCGGFRVLAGGQTEISFYVPYTVKRSSRWVVTAVDKNHHWPGRIVMT